MPEYNRIGDWLAGVGGGNPDDPASWVPMVVNGRVVDPGPGGGGSWLNDDEAVAVRYSSYADFRCVAIHKATGAPRLLRPGVFTRVAAGGGRWATQLRDGGGPWALDDGTPIPFPVVGFARDGALLTQAHPTNGLGLVVNPRFDGGGNLADGAVLSRELAWDVCALSATQVAWRERDGPHAVGMPPIFLLPGRSYQLRVAHDGFRWWALYQASEYNGQLVLHPFDSFDGYALTTPGADAFRAALRFEGPVPFVVWATRESEGPGQIAGPFNVPIQFVRKVLREPTPVPIPSPSPVPPPPHPSPEEPPMPTSPAPASQVGLVEAVRAKYPRSAPGSSPIGADAWIAICEVAQRTRTKVFRKDAGDDGSHTFIPRGLLAAYPDGVWISRTIVGRGVFGDRWVKVFGDGEGAAKPIWDVGETPADGEYVDVSALVLPGASEPPSEPHEPPAPPSVDLGPVYAEIAKLRAEMEGRHAAIAAAVEDLGAHVRALTARVDALSAPQPAPPLPPLVARGKVTWADVILKSPLEWKVGRE